jgi:hypothetical protein
MNGCDNYVIVTLVCEIKSTSLILEYQLRDGTSPEDVAKSPSVSLKLTATAVTQQYLPTTYICS